MRQVSPAAPRDDKRWRMVDARIRRLGNSPEGLIEVLHTVQEAFGYLDHETLAYVGNALGVPPSRTYGVATFYSHFTMKPQGEHTCVVCTGTACYINGAGSIIKRISSELNVEPGETTADNRLSLLTARCLGACSLAPAVVFDNEVQGKLTPDDVMTHLEQLS
ncbi:MAG: bidirectional hydrogenase complex protein HoxE [Micromonosporaceae bacterium]|nr:bidirectional hydrogenase complex protein HoxE [Micromonosporaceae bacterium]